MEKKKKCLCGGILTCVNFESVPLQCVKILSGLDDAKTRNFSPVPSGLAGKSGAIDFTIRTDLLRFSIEPPTVSDTREEVSHR